MKATVERLMRFARPERGDHRAAELLDLLTLAQSVVEEVPYARGGEIRCSGEAAEDARVVVADRFEIYEALSNLVENGVKYGGSSPVQVEVTRDGGKVLCRVRDRGPGIAVSDRERIFERFFRGERARALEGSGLGLAIAQRAAAHWGGSVRLERAEPGDTCFVLDLPAAGAP